MSTERIKLLAHWIRERRAIRLRRLNGDVPPWTSDTILRDYRFCNVEREHDAVTMWIAENWRNPNSEHPNLVVAMVLARLLNNPDTLAWLGFPKEWDAPWMKQHIKYRRDAGHKILNAAYVVTTCGVKMDKVDYIVDLATEVQNCTPILAPGATLEGYHSILMTFKGLGNFLAGQVVADLKNTPGNPLQKAADYWSWAAVGPGSIKGLRAVLARPDVSERHFLPLATKLYADTQEIYGEPLNLHMQDFQNCLCEFSKYWRAYTGEGKPKQRYHGGR
jgi:alpha-glutamyl/putrescinyl thymine pyrophosphorylase clade 1